MIELVNGLCDFRVGNGSQVVMLQEVLSNETLLSSFKPRSQDRTRMHEVDRPLKVTSRGFMFGKIVPNISR